MMYLYLCFLQSFNMQWLGQHCLLFLWQCCSLVPSHTALLKMCTVSHPLLPHAHPALTIQPTVPHSLSIHKKLYCILTPTLLWYSYQVIIILIQNITVANVARLTMHGESSSGSGATVVCNGPVGLSFTSMADFKIQYLAFAFFGRDTGNTSSNNKYAMLLNSIPYGELINCSFHDNFGTALVVNNTAITLAGNEFSHNLHCGNNSGEGIIGGSAIIVLDSNLTFTGNTTFLKNDISCSRTKQSQTGGGAIITAGYTVLSFHGICNFISNSADSKGGAILH